MQLKKLLAAGAIGALMTTSTIAFAADLSNYPQPFVSSDGALQSLVVVGTGVATTTPSDMAKDIVAGIDLGARVGSDVSEPYSITGGTAVAAQGKKKDVPVNTALNDATNGFGTELSFRHLPQLRDTTVTFGSTEMRISEYLTVPSATVNVQNPSDMNGYVRIGTIGSAQGLEYKLKFKNNLTGFSLDKPFEIEMLGKNFQVINTSATDSTFTALVGDVAWVRYGTVKTIGAYTIEVTEGGVDQAFLVLKKNGVLVDEGFKSVGDTLDDGEYSVKVLQVTLTTVPTDSVAVKIVAGTDTEATYEAGDAFPGETDWEFADLSFSQNNKLGKTDVIGVKYVPDDDIEINETQKLSLPANTLDVDFATTTATARYDVEIASGGTTKLNVYNPADPAVQTTKNGVYLKFTSTAPSAFAIGSDEFDTVYLVRNASYNYVWAYDDTVEDKILNLSARSNQSSALSIKIGDAILNVTLASGNETDTPKLIIQPLAGGSYFTADYRYNSTDTQIVLGLTKGEAEAADLKVDTTNIGTREYNWMTAYGLIAYGIDTVVDDEKVKLSVPNVDGIKATVVIGKATSETTTGSTIKKAVAVKTPVGKLDTEVTSSDKTNQNLVLVGGPCANQLVADIMASQKAVPACTNAWYTRYSLATGEAVGIIEYVADAWGTGKAAIIVAGTNADDTRAAAAVLQNYEAYSTKLVGTKVKVVGTTVTSLA